VSFDQLHIPQKKSQIWAVGGGKGGVGKSFISSSLAICLGRLGFSVTALDLDLGSANLHTCLGAPIPKLSLSDFLNNRVESLEDLLQETKLLKVQFISGSNDAVNIPNLSGAQKQRLLKGISNLSTDFIILDLGAGTHNNTLDFFLYSDVPILTSVPEPTSIENTYRFIKSSFYRKLCLLTKDPSLKELIDQSMDHRNTLGIRTPRDLIHHIEYEYPQKGHWLIQEMNRRPYTLILNQIRTRPDIQLGGSIRSVCRQYFGLNLNYCGYLDYDNAVWQALRKREPLLVAYPFSSLVGQFLRITKNLVYAQPMKAVV